jgi:hypothetical protein
MTAFCKQYTDVFGVHLIKKVIQNYERRSTLCVVKIFGYTLLKRLFPCNVANCCDGTAVVSLQHQIMPPSKFCSLHSEFRFCSNVIQKDVFP